MRKVKLGVTIAIIIFIALTFIFFTYLKTTAGDNKLKYPTSVNCDKINDQFTENAEFKKYAVID